MRFALNILLISCCTGLMFACNEDTKQNNREATEITNKSAAGEASQTKQEDEEKVILFFGNSITAAYGLEPSESFPAIIQQKIDSLGYDYKVVNAGLSGETTAAGKNRIDWVLERQQVDVFVLELGANDGLRGLDPQMSKENLAEIIDKVRAANPDVKIILAGMMVPPSMGGEYAKRFSSIFPELAAEKDVELIPFLLDNVAGERALNQADGIHPTAEGQKIVAETVWLVLEELIKDTEENTSEAGAS